MQVYNLKENCLSHLPLYVKDTKKLYPVMQLHSHSCIEIIFIYNGAGSCFINDRCYPMLPRDLYVIQPFETHKYQNDSGLRFYNIMFDHTLFSADEMNIYERFAAKYNSHGFPKIQTKYTFSPSAFEHIMGMLRRIDKELKEQKPYFDSNAKAFFIQFLVYILRNLESSAPITFPSHHLDIGRVFDYIENHYRKRISLKDLAAITGNNPAYLSRQFKSLIGINISEYISRYRIEKARYELENTTMPIAEIAEKTGFYDQSYFIKSFQRFCWLTPAQYRKVCKEYDENV